MTNDRSPSLPLELRATRVADFETLYAIDQVCYAPAIAYTRAELRSYLGMRGAQCMVAEIHALHQGASSRPRIAGFVLGVSRNAHGHIVTIDVLEVYRRAGVGSALLQSVESKMARDSVTDVWLETATNNEPAIAFWKKHGYRSHRRLPHYYADGVDALSMSKTLVHADPVPAKIED